MAENNNNSGRSSFSNRFSGYSTSLLSNLRDIARYKAISDIGIDFSLIGKKGRIGVSKKETSESEEDALLYTSLLPKDTEIEARETPYFDSKYHDRVRYLTVFASHPEIEFITNTLTDESIVYDKFGKFCSVEVNDTKMKDEVKKAITKNFTRIYSLLNFGDGITAWAYFLQWLIEGWLAWEIIYDNTEKPTRITGFQELAVSTLVSIVIDEEVENEATKTKSKRKKRVWKQIVKKKDGTVEERVIPDNSIIVIAYNKIPGNNGRISYVERLIRSFNLMRTMENTKVAWHVMNSQFRLKMIVPVGTKTTAKAKQALAVVTNKYKEDLFIDHNSGEVHINGQAKINFGRNIVLPQRNGQTPDISGIKYDGPDLSNMDGVKYFERKLWRDSRLPFSRFDRENGGGANILFNAEGVPHDELSFYKFVNRLRKGFEPVIKKPVYLQTLLDFPELKVDLEFQSKLAVNYESNSLFEEAKQEEIKKRKLENLGNDERMTEIDGSTPIYSKKYLYVNKYGLMTEAEWGENRKLRDDELKESKLRTEQQNAPAIIDTTTQAVTTTPVDSGDGETTPANNSQADVSDLTKTDQNKDILA